MSTIDWHRLFGMALEDFFSDLPFTVELEKDLSLRQQFLDVVVVRKEPGEIGQELPDGFDNLSDHNLITYKSMREALDEDAVEEFVGHSVNYRKQVSTTSEWLPKSAVSLYAVCTRFPQKLAGRVTLAPLAAEKPGVYHLAFGTVDMRVIVLGEIRDTDANRMWGIFSGKAAKVWTAALGFHPKRDNGSTILNDLFTFYRMEGLTMPYTREEYLKDAIPRFIRDIPPRLIVKEIPPEELLKEIPVEERLKGLPAEDLLKAIPKEERLKGLPAEDLLKAIPQEERLKGLPTEERLKDLSLEEIQAYLAKRLKEQASEE